MSKKAIIFGLLVLFFAWAVVALVVDKPMVPAPWVVIYSFFADLPRGLGWHALVSGWRIIASMFIATAIGLPLGLVLGQNRRWDKILYPLVYLTYPVPKVALLPIIILFFGIGDASKIFLISLILFFQVLVVVRDASRNIPAQLVLSLRSLGADRWQLLRHVYFPASLPAVLTSLRLNVAIAIAVLYLAESFATASGLGYYVMDAWQRMDYARMYATVGAMSLIGFIAFVILALMEDKLCHWAQVGK
ncbi:MAG: ABC transporter permease [Chloroflexota bacterium]